MNVLLKNLFDQTLRFAILLIVLVGMIAYHNCLPNEMFWDDDDFINNNRYIRDFHYWPLWFSQNLVAGSYLVSNYWRPLLLIIFSIEWHWWHNWVYGWHAVSVGVHILAGVTLYFLINRLFAVNLLALLVALIFVAHPVHNEAVVYVNSMGDSLATFIVLSSLLIICPFPPIPKAGLGYPFLLGFLAAFSPWPCSPKRPVLCSSAFSFNGFSFVVKGKNFLEACRSSCRGGMAVYHPGDHLYHPAGNGA